MLDTHFFPYFISRMEEVEETSPKSFVYLITDGNFVKIGVADNIKNRLNGIQTGNPNKCKVICAIPCKDSNSAFSLERKLHWEYRLRKKRGEWYDLITYIDVESFKACFPPEDYVNEEDVFEIIT